MQAPALPVTTTCTNPAVDHQLHALIVELVEVAGLTVREATERAARKAAADALARGWRSELVDFVVIRTADLGARYAAALSA